MHRIERGRDREYQWVRPAPARLYQNRATSVDERRRQGSHGEFINGRSTRDDHARQDLPSFPNIEHLLRIYVASGEARGAFLVAKALERQGRSRGSSTDSLDSSSSSGYGGGSPRPPQGPRGPRRPRGPRGPRGDEGPRGPPGDHG